MPTKEIGALDRATFAVWRVANVIGWGIVALAGAAILRFGTESFASQLHFGFGDAHWTRNRVAYLIGVGLIGQIASGAFVGTVIGTRVPRSPVATALCVAGLGALLHLLAFEPWAWCCDRPWIYAVSLSASLAIPAAAVSARIVSKRRPGALR